MSMVTNGNNALGVINLPLAYTRGVGKIEKLGKLRLGAILGVNQPEEFGNGISINLCVS